MIIKKTTKFLTDFACVEKRDEYHWRNGLWWRTYWGYLVVTTEVWEALLEDGEAMPASFINPGGKPIGEWRCEDRCVTDPFGSPLRRAYREIWIRRGRWVDV